MKRKILFLDIDGVLNVESNSYMTCKHNKYLIEAHLTQRLNYICSKIDDIEIVISSSWRNDMTSLKKELLRAGFVYWHKVVGNTNICPYTDSLERGKQINEWLRENISKSFMPGIDADIVILDDEQYGIIEFWDNQYFIHVDKEEGLSNSAVNLVLKALSGNHNGL